MSKKRKCPRCPAIGVVRFNKDNEYATIWWTREDETWITSRVTGGELLDPGFGCGFCGDGWRESLYLCRDLNERAMG